MNGGDLILKALDLEARCHISFCDALVILAARGAGGRDPVLRGPTRRAAGAKSTATVVSSALSKGGKELSRVREGGYDDRHTVLMFPIVPSALSRRANVALLLLLTCAVAKSRRKAG